MKIKTIFSLLFIQYSLSCFASQPQDSYVDSAYYDDGDKIPYLLTTTNSKNPQYALILMPGGNGVMKIQKNPDETVYFHYKGNFLIRSRILFADNDFIVISTDADRSLKRMRAIIADVRSKYLGIKIYIAGTSSSTRVTSYQSENMDGEVQGFIHTSSLNLIGGLDTRNSKSRNLIVTHKDDECKFTPPSSSIENHERYGTDLIVMEGGFSEGDPCEAMGHHGFRGIEQETVQKIKNWIIK
jgi:hypothetical protein